MPSIMLSSIPHQIILWMQSGKGGRQGAREPVFLIITRMMREMDIGVHVYLSFVMEDDCSHQVFLLFY